MTTDSQEIIVGQQRRWQVAKPTSVLPGFDLPYLIGHLLWRRGIRDSASAREFLEVSESLFENPSTLPDVDLAARRLDAAEVRQETVAVFGDFDADGVTGTALLVKALRRYGVTAIAYIPHRVTEGHGLNIAAITSLWNRGVRLIVTVDCGVTDVAQVAHAKDLGIDVIITDHHLVTENLPDAVAIINPHAPHSDYAFDHLTGVGMVLKLAQAVLEPKYGESWANDLFELAAIGTITDMAPLLGENRYIVHQGIRQLQRTSSLGLRSLLGLARVAPAHATAETIGFAIGPRLNAAGRLDHADTSLALMLTEEPEQASALAKELDSYNGQRQVLTEETYQRARALLPAVIPSLIFIGESDFNPGVVGLVAGKLAEEFGVPAAVFGMDGARVMASCRSTPGFNWAHALNGCADLLTRFGGHAQAAGFSCDKEVLPELEERLVSVAVEQLGELQPPDLSTVDAEVQIAELMGETFRLLQQLGPFGIGNPAPVFLTRKVQVQKAATMGADKQHFRLTIRSGGAIWQVVAFRQHWQPDTEFIDIIYTIDIDHWNGEPRLRLTLKDYAKSDRPKVFL